MSNPVTTRGGSKSRAGSRGPDDETKPDVVEEIFDKPDRSLPSSPQPSAVSEERFEKFISEMSYAFKSVVNEVHSAKMDSKLQAAELEKKFQYVLDANTVLSEEVHQKFASIIKPVAAENLTPAFKSIWDSPPGAEVDQSKDKYQIPVQSKPKPSTARRGSIFAHSQVSDADEEKILNQSPIVFARTSTVLKEGERQQTLSVKAYLYNKERYDELKSQNLEDKVFTLATTISQQVIRKLINNERVHNTAMSQLSGFGPNAFYGYPDDVVIDMFALYFKPTSPQKFGELFYSALKDLVLKSEIKGWLFGHKNYHNALFANLNELLFKMEEVYNLLTKMQKRGEEGLYPKLVWGKKNMPGLWRYFTFLFGAYEENLIHALPDQEETLKAVKTEAEFFALYRKLNDTLAKQSREQEIANERLIVTGTLQEQFPQYSMDGEPKGPTVRKWQREDAGSSLKLVSAEAYTEQVKPPQSENAADEQMGEDPAEFYLGRSSYPNKPYVGDSSANSAYPKLYKDKPAERMLPCYSWAQHKKCPTGAACVWSHDDKVCREYAEKQVTLLAESPFLNSKVKEAIISAYLPTASVNAKGSPSHPSVSFRTPISQNVHGKMLMMESDQKDNADVNDGVLSDTKDKGDY